MHWKKKALSDATVIYRDNQPIGTLKHHSLKRRATGNINGKRYSFRTVGLFRPYTVVHDITTGRQVASIHYHYSWTRANIDYLGEKMEWKRMKGLSYRTCVITENDQSIEFRSHQLKGNIKGGVEIDFQVLSGLFIADYYRQIGLAVGIAILLPLFLTFILE